MHRVVSALALVMLVSAALAADQSRPAVSPAMEEKIRSTVTALMEADGIPGLSVAIALENELAYAAGFGMADVENAVPATAETIYRTASIAKSITAVAVMQLAEQGRIDLDAPVQRYCSSFPEKEWPVTIRQLLSHTAGVRHYDYASSKAEQYSTAHVHSVAEAVLLFADDPLRFEPGTEYLYSTFGYNLLGAVVEAAAGVEFDAYLRKSIFAPAAMQSTRTDNHFAVVPHRARGYLRLSERVKKNLPMGWHRRFAPGELYNAPLHDTSMKVAGGGLLSTAPDLVRLATALNRGQLLAPEMLETMWTGQKLPDGSPTDYGLGWRILDLDGEKAVGHSGGQAGVSTYLVLCPQRQAAAATMCNLQGVELRPLAVQILALATEGAEKAPSAEGLAAVPNPRLPKDDRDVERRLTEFIEREIKDKEIPALSIAVVEDGETVIARGFGQANPHAGQQATADKVYRVGSVSKLFTDLAVMELVAAGKLDLDADVREYLPEFAPQNPFGTPITLRQLMSHQSGLVRESPVGHYFDDTGPSLADTVKSLNTTTLVFKPGARTKYSNSGVSVAGLVVEKIVGKAFEEHVRETLLEPLEMTHSGFRRDEAIAERLATAWMRSHHVPPFEAPDFALGTLPAGNLYSSMNELSNLLIAILNRGQFRGESVIDSAVLDAMLEPARAEGERLHEYGIGFRLGEIDGRRTIGHGGAVYGFSTQLTALPDDGIGVAASASLDGANGSVRRITDYAVRLLLARREGKPLPEIEQTKPIPTELARKLVGRYASGNNLLEIQDDSGVLYVYDGLFLKRLRALGDALVVDDLLGYGPKIEVAGDDTLLMNHRVWQRIDPPCPPPAPERWKGLIGEYGWDHNPLYVFEDRGQLWVLIEWFYFYPLTELSPDVFAFPEWGLYHGEQLIFAREGEGPASHVTAASVRFDRRDVGPEEGVTFRVEPRFPTDVLEARARDAIPPIEHRPMREHDLVELTSLDPSIKLDVRYATTNNFLSTVFYREPRAFMQRPAAEAVVRVHQRLREQGYGLLVHDAYRPWYVTKMFWEAMPHHLRGFVADPEQGSKHNRGCAVDLTLFELATGEPVIMVAGYDEMSPRSYPLYPGGTARQRWHRKLLREAMEREGFTIYPLEWWHFDYKDWKQYPIGNASFDAILAADAGDG